MAQKHKSKYKAPKDLEKSRKLTPRKDLKDYTMDDKDGKLNPKSTKEKQLNVLRKTDKETVDTGKMDVKYDADDRLYKKLEDGDYDPKTASKRFKKRLDQEEKETKDQIKDKIENLTREQKEHLVRQYVRRKIQRIIAEQAKDAAAEDPAAATPEPPADAAAPPAAGAAPGADAGATPAPGAEAAPGADAGAGATPPPAGAKPAPTGGTTPPPAGDAAKPDAGSEKDSEEAEEEKLDPEAKQALDTDRFIKSIKKMTGTVEKVKAIAKVVKDATDDLEYDDSKNFYQMLRTYAINKLERLGADKKSKK